MLVNLSKLDKSILEQIPLSIRLSVGTSSIELDELPLSIQYIIRESVEKDTTNIHIPSDVYDYKPTITPYNDLESLQIKKDTVIEYFRNYLSVKKGMYPFDPEFGNSLYLHLQKKDTSLRNMLINEELTDILNVVNQSFDGAVRIVDSQVYSVDNGGGVEYHLEVKISVDEETVTLNTR